MKIITRVNAHNMSENNSDQGFKTMSVNNNGRHPLPYSQSTRFSSFACNRDMFTSHSETSRGCWGSFHNADHYNPQPGKGL